MFLIYTHKLTNRITYILDFILEQNLGIKYRITTQRSDFIDYRGPKINYSLEPFEHCINIQPVLLLFQEDITPQHIETKRYQGTEILFVTDKGDLPFDIFAASFYLLSRYEEYGSSRLDRFGRFDPRNSIAWQKGFLTEPVVNIWIEWFSTLIKEKYSDLSIKSHRYRFVPTIDIDNAYAFKNKGIIRQVGGLAKSLLKPDIREFVKRLKVYFGKITDPFDTYGFIEQINERYNISPLYFFLLANYGGYDCAVPFDNKEFQELVLNIAQKHKVGIHPSFSSFFDFSVLESEISTLAEMISKDVEYSRFHFVKFSLPDSYVNLINCNIFHDFSMGYPSRIGFRSGYAGSFNFFNLKTNQSTKLELHPFNVMDASLNLYMKLSPDEAVVQVRQLIDKVKQVKGTFSLLWHNESLSGIGVWHGWKTVYEQIVRYAVER